MRTTGLVLAAGTSSRLGRPKQLLGYHGRTLLDATLDMARSCEFDQLIVTVGGGGPDVLSTVDLSGCTVVDNAEFASGCSSSIVVALASVDERADALVHLLGDQPGIDPGAVRALCSQSEIVEARIGVCRYDNGLGHPFWFARNMFGNLRRLHGDKAVWKLVESGHLDSGKRPVHESRVDGPVPLDVDTWADYERLLESTT
jgi:molybdenum cofactor cytidylyltransferase